MNIVWRFVIINMLIVCSVSVGMSQEQEPVCHQEIGSCEYYICVNQAMGCGASSYMRRFGQPYCQLFVDHEEEFDQEGQNFNQQVRLCLQQKMERDFDQMTCGASRKFALKHHIECYHQAGFCQLPWHDKQLILNAAWTEFFNLDFLKTALEMNLKCL